MILSDMIYDAKAALLEAWTEITRAYYTITALLLEI